MQAPGQSCPIPAAEPSGSKTPAQNPAGSSLSGCGGAELLRSVHSFAWSKGHQTRYQIVLVLTCDGRGRDVGPETAAASSGLPLHADEASPGACLVAAAPLAEIGKIFSDGALLISRCEFLEFLSFHPPSCKIGV